MSEPETQDRNSGSLHCYPSLTFGSLFAGIGGFDLGFERAGMVCRWQVEIDEYANRVLAKHWPDVRRWPDVRTWPQPDTERVDIICGGFPCQDISLAGSGKGIEGERSGLWADFARIICELRPAIVVVENSPAITVRGFDRVLGDLAEQRYDAEWSVLSACRMGAAHMRKRMFIVAHDATVRPLRNCKQNTGLAGNDGWGLLESQRTSWRATEPDVGRVVDGVPNGLDKDRIGCLGNSVVPQVAEWIGHAINRAVFDG